MKTMSQIFQLPHPAKIKVRFTSVVGVSSVCFWWFWEPEGSVWNSESAFFSSCLLYWSDRLFCRRPVKTERSKPTDTRERVSLTFLSSGAFQRRVSPASWDKKRRFWLLWHSNNSAQVLVWLKDFYILTTRFSADRIPVMTSWFQKEGFLTQFWKIIGLSCPGCAGHS